MPAASPHSPPGATLEDDNGASTADAARREMRRRARWGVTLLGARSALQQLLVLAANVYLARTLRPRDYGIFAILQFALSLFQLLGDAGLGAALIQQHEAPSRRELSSIWWFQLALCAVIMGAAFVVGPWVLDAWPDLPPESPWLLRGLSLGLLFTMLRSMPWLLLERNLRFGWLAALELGGSVAFYGSAVALAAMGAGAAALVTATVCQAAALAVAANLVQPWRPTLDVDRAQLARLVRFGLSFQAKHVVGFVNGAVTPLIAGIRLGQEALGLVQFAQSVAWLPTVPMGIISRVTFPLLCRLQKDEQAFAEELEHAIALCALPTLLFAGLVIGVAPSIVHVVYSDRWAPAVPAIYAYAAAIAVGYFVWIGSAAFDALGRPDLTLRLAIAVTLFNWPSVLVATSVSRTPLAFAIGFCLHVVLYNVLVAVILARLVPRARIVSRLLAPALAGAVVAVLGRLSLPWTGTVPGLVGWSACAVLLYAAVALSLDPRLRRTLVRALAKRARAESTADARPAASEAAEPATTPRPGP
jgi:O-antigen/teichoic acid export membrane protein